MHADPLFAFLLTLSEGNRRVPASIVFCTYNAGQCGGDAALIGVVAAAEANVNSGAGNGRNGTIGGDGKAASDIAGPTALAKLWGHRYDYFGTDISHLAELVTEAATAAKVNGNAAWLADTALRRFIA